MISPNRLRSSTPRVLPWVIACAMAATSRASAQPAAPAQPAAATPAEQPAPQAPDPLEVAREAYARGQTLFAQGNFAQAKAAFNDAYAAAPNPTVLLSSAECDLRLGNLEGSYALLQQYLAERPDAPDRAEVEQKANDLLATPARIAVTSEPAGAQISIDGKDTGRVTPAEIDLVRGEHTVELSLAGFESTSEPMTARIGARHELQVTLREAPPPPLADLKLTTEAQQPTTALWITSIVGAAGIVTGTVLGFMVLAERSDYDANPTKASADRGERLALFTDVAFGVGAMSLVTAAVLYLTADVVSAESAPDTASAPFQVAPSASLRGAGLSARGRF